ncbi:GspE/PulE family protein [Sulfurimonas sp. HSL-3221]|uniref:GspE/PulE family protein n=1 Tax=Sulfurimonadaceae TaxID=2771471 RepID=UPI001E2F7452|nr:GspE/PulE family protein [Sulfurimonas sp. HSL-3221]UFS62157.1 GspE/PulE family protein [Sulfurimonas sp. HSL-3221]
MLNIPELEGVDLKPHPLESVDLNLSLRSYVLFSEIDGEVHIVLGRAHLSQSFDFLAKFDLDLPLVIVDADSFDRLYNKFLEIRTDSELSGIEQEQEEIEEEEMSLSDFLHTSSDLLTSEESAPVIKFVNALFYQAVKQRASDIHVEVHEYKGEVRFRVDGALTKHADIEKRVANLIISRIKVISNLDIAEKRIPQDGRTHVKIAGKTLDVRVSVLPTYYGERVVMRMLMQSEDIPHLEGLGFDHALTKHLDEMLKHSHGIILVTGPTGSGKSTTLHAFLQQVATPDINIITVEDPVEYKADNINQVQTNAKAGLTFASGLRSILRQDPDVVMVGEIRDSETAEIAIQAALTGHLVFSTLHTNNATASITRLVDMGIEQFLISSSLLGVLAQRLVRKLCPECKQQTVLADEYAEELDLPKGAVVFEEQGCKACNYTGYAGRQAIGEFFEMTDELVAMLKDQINDHDLRAKAIALGMTPLSGQLKTLLLNGTTSLHEIIRVGVKDA